MSRFGWAYVNSLATGSVANGPTNSIQFNSGSQILSGSENLTFDPSTNTLIVTGTISASVYQGITITATPAGSDKQIQYNSGSTLAASSNLTFDYDTNTLYVTGTLRADNLIVSSSQILKSGSTIFGDDISDTHQFTGSILGGIVSGTIARFIVVTGSTITGSTGLFGVVTSSAFSGGTFVGTTISGTTAEFSTISASNSLVSNTTTIGNYAKFQPVNFDLPSDTSASYIYTSGSTNDLYFTQFNPSDGIENTTRLRWIEGGSLGTGLLYGGILTTVNGTTSFNISEGNGIIINFNATTSSSPYPTAKLVSWSNFTSQSLTYSGSNQITYVAIDTSGNVEQRVAPFSTLDRKNYIVLGRILHQTGAVTNGTINAPVTAYASIPDFRDFFRSFGPLKVSGHTLRTSGSTLGILKDAGSSYAEGRNYAINPNIANFISETDDPALTDSKIFREYVSGSDYIIDTNGNAGFAVLDPTQYNNNGTLTSVSPASKFTIQRLYWFPNSVNRAIFAYYGTDVYASIDDAVVGLGTEEFVEGGNTSNAAIYLGAVILAGNATDLTDPAEAKIISAGLFRGIPAGGGGGGSTSPGGVSNSIQYNDGGGFNGSANLTFDSSTNQFSLTGSLIVSGTAENVVYVSSSSPAFKISQQGTGLSFIVEDQTGPDASPFAIDTNGNVGVGTAIPSDKLHVVGSIKGTTSISGTIGLYNVLSASIVTASSNIQVASNAVIGGNILGSGGFKAGYATYSSDFTASVGSYFVGIDSTSTAITASLNSVATYPAGQTLIFKDIGGNAGTNNILIKPSGSQTIDNASGFIIATNSGSVTLISNGTNQFYIAGIF